MSLQLPPRTSELREYFDVKDLAHWRNFEDFRTARRKAHQIARDVPGVRWVTIIALRANGSLELGKVGPRNGYTKLWNFGFPV